MKACFTGHRPNKLKGGYDYYSKPNLELGRRIRTTCVDLIVNHAVDTFICGGAIGVDQMAFMVCNKLKERYPHIKIVLAMPFEQQAVKWNKDTQELFKKHKELADTIVLVDEIESYRLNNIEKKIYHPAKMQKRNEYMVDNSDFVVAVWNGDETGGTANCVNYARKLNKNIVRIEVETVS